MYKYLEEQVSGHKNAIHLAGFFTINNFFFNHSSTYSFLNIYKYMYSIFHAYIRQLLIKIFVVHSDKFIVRLIYTHKNSYDTKI